MKYNENFLRLSENYLFSEVKRRVEGYKNPPRKILSLGVGDVRLPLSKASIEKMQKGVEDMARAQTFRGYPPAFGYPILQESLKSYYKRFSAFLDEEEFFISDGAKREIVDLLDLFPAGSVAMIPDPTYPVYKDANLLRGNRILYKKGTLANGFLPMPSGEEVDFIYLCNPGNPTGATYTREQLKVWVDYAISQNAVLFYDNAYERFLDEKSTHSIYEIEGAKDCAIEIGSFSKMAGFTGIRLGWTIVPKRMEMLHVLWKRRQAMGQNGVSYISQMAGVGALSKNGLREMEERIAYYTGNRRTIANCMQKLGWWHLQGGAYVWAKCLNGSSSWEFFDALLEKAQIVCTPGVGFGESGEGYIRLSALGEKREVEEACKRLEATAW